MLLVYGGTCVALHQLLVWWGVEGPNPFLYEAEDAAES
jgi:hypothetical protein